MIRFHLLHCMTDRRGEKEDNLCKTKRRQSEDREEGRNSLGREADYDPTSAMSNNSPLLVEQYRDPIYLPVVCLMECLQQYTRLLKLRVSYHYVHLVSSAYFRLLCYQKSQGRLCFFAHLSNVVEKTLLITPRASKGISSSSKILQGIKGHLGTTYSLCLHLRHHPIAQQPSATHPTYYPCQVSQRDPCFIVALLLSVLTTFHSMADTTAVTTPGQRYSKL